jgi:uncharacterized protein (DUF302 family)
MSSESSLDDNAVRSVTMYAYRRQVDVSYEHAVQRVREELQKEGFRILTEINVKETLKKKLDFDFDKYVILGACNPPFAHRASQAERDVGIVMPCNVIAHEHEGKTFVASTLPTVTMAVVKNDRLAPLAAQVESELKKAIGAV